MEQIKIEVNKKINGKYSKVGEQTIYVPTLAEAGFEAAIEMDKDGKPVFEDGLPVYKEDKHNWVQGAILAQVKAQARNKLVPGTADLKPGQAIATDWAALTAEGERGGNGEALAIVREAKQKFAAWVLTLGKSQGAQNALNMLFGNRNALALQGAAQKAKMADYIAEFASTLEDAEVERYGKYLESLDAVCKETIDAEDF